MAEADYQFLQHRMSVIKTYNTNRPPQYHQSSTPSQPPQLPHHSAQQPHWPQSPYPSPLSNAPQEYYTPSPNTPPNFPPHLQMMTQSMERNNNEPSMVTPNRYTQMTDMRIDPTPSDPREWTDSDVIRWIQWASATFKIRNLHPDRFQMNGKALCLMDLSMFLYRVPDGGEKLYQDFQTRLQKALSQEKMR